MNQKLLIWGSGELGSRVGARWTQGPVMGFTATRKRHSTLQALGIEPRLGTAVSALESNDSLLLSLPGYTRQMAAVRQLLPHHPPKKVVLISSTGYYDYLTGLVNENTPPGKSEKSQAIAFLEQTFQKWSGTQGVIIRLGGLYGPGRGPFPALLRKGMPSVQPADRVLPLIHYEDAATAVLAALTNPAPARVYLGIVSPCPNRFQFYARACQKLALPLPKFKVPRGLPPAVIDISLVNRDLLPNPAFPDWRSALNK